MNSWIFVFLTVLLTVYGQIIVKWKVLAAGSFPAQFSDQIIFLAKLLLSPWVLSALGAGLLAAFCWMAALAKLPLSRAYPFTSLSFGLVLFLSSIFFQEPLTWPKIIGLAVIVVGIAVGSQG